MSELQDDYVATLEGLLRECKGELAIQDAIAANNEKRFVKIRAELSREQAKTRTLSKLLKEAAGTMSVGRWSSEFRAKVMDALKFRMV